MELVTYIYQVLNNQYPNKCVVGAVEREIDDSIIIFEIDFNNVKSKENVRVGDTAVIQITKHGNTLAALYDLYDYCVDNLTPDQIECQSCVVDGRNISTFDNGLYRMDTRVMISK